MGWMADVALTNREEKKHCRADIVSLNFGSQQKNWPSF